MDEAAEVIQVRPQRLEARDQVIFGVNGSPFESIEMLPEPRSQDRIGPGPQERVTARPEAPVRGICTDAPLVPEGYRGRNHGDRVQASQRAGERPEPLLQEMFPEFRK